MSALKPGEMVAILDAIPIPADLLRCWAAPQATALMADTRQEAEAQTAAADRAIEDQMFKLLGISRDDVAKYGSLLR